MAGVVRCGVLAGLIVGAAAIAPVFRASRRVALVGAVASFAGSPTASRAIGGGSTKDFERSVASAYAAFTKGDYAASEQLWAQITEQFPDASLGWQNYAT
eukprot:5430662-Prymnesium_polylepis.1